MSQEAEQKHLASIVMDRTNQPVIVSMNVEDDDWRPAPDTNLICRSKASPQVGKMNKPFPPGDLPPARGAGMVGLLWMFPQQQSR